MTSISKDRVNFLTVCADEDGQRLDNYLNKHLKGVPHSYIHRIIRQGEVRVNKKRVRSDARIQTADIIRIPPVRVAQRKELDTVIPVREFEVIFEDDGLLVINKPAGIAVHGGSGISFGVIEQLRHSRSNSRYLELVHRLDKDTSGLLMIAKKRQVLVRLHEQMRLNHPKKVYLALCSPVWPASQTHVKLPLHKYTGASGEKMVRVKQGGQSAHTIFRIVEQFKVASLVEATLKTGRTHQIRVHMQACGSPILGDERYGDYARNREWISKGLKRMFLHAYQLTLNYPNDSDRLVLTAPLSKNLLQLLDTLRKERDETL